ncbi:MAG: hypothetical protein IPP29_21225 [Bacteroidetes bacterium]|nr:hypothetical protein [Bacteroidota bacterium]
MIDTYGKWRTKIIKSKRQRNIIPSPIIQSTVTKRNYWAPPPALLVNTVIPLPGTAIGADGMEATAYPNEGTLVTVRLN